MYLSSGVHTSFGRLQIQKTSKNHKNPYFATQPKNGCLKQSRRLGSVGTRGMTLTKIGTVLVLNGKPLHTDFQSLGVLVPPPTIALNMDQILTGRPGIALQQGGASTLGKSARGRD